MDEDAVMTRRRSGRIWVGPVFDPESDSSTRPLSGSQPGDGAHMHHDERDVGDDVETQRRAPFGFTCRREADWS